MDQFGVFSLGRAPVSAILLISLASREIVSNVFFDLL